MLSNDIDTAGLLHFYEKGLKEDLLPFWLNKGIDEEYGGYFTCFDNRGKNLISTDKFTWSQGRFIWILSKLSTMDIFHAEERTRFIELAGKGAEFLMKYCLLDNGHCTFLMDRRGNKKKMENHIDYDISTYADCFVVYGLAKFGVVANDKLSLELAKRLYRSIEKRIENGTFRTIPYSTPKGFKAHGIPMIMSNLSDEFSICLKAIKDPYAEKAQTKAVEYMNEIMNGFLSEDGLIHEMIPTVPVKKDSAPLFERCINPGHTIEGMWFVIHIAEKSGDKDIINQAVNVIKKTFDIGWDKKYGGMYTFVDQNGGKPAGDPGEYEDNLMVHKIMHDWDMKLWWPHSEALYATLLGYSHTSDPRLLAMYKKIHEYTFSTFPNKDDGIREWIQIRNRDGSPIDKVVALPVKDPYHILRNFILIIELLKSKKWSVEK